MRVQQISFTRVKSDRSFGNRQATVVMVVDDGDDPVEAMVEARRQAEQAVTDDYAVASFQAPKRLGDYIEDDEEEYDDSDSDYGLEDTPEVTDADVGAGVTP